MIEEETIKFFSSLYSFEVRAKLFVEGIDWSPILNKKDEDLVSTMEEIKKVVFMKPLIHPKA